MTADTPMTAERGSLNSAPPSSGQSKNILDVQKGGSPIPSTPSMQALAAMGMIKNGARQMSAALPNLAPPLMQMVQQLEAILPRAMSESLSGGGGEMIAQPTPPPPQ